MTRGMYAAAGGMLVGLGRNEVLANNLSNGSTPGFKADRASYGSFQRVLLPGVKGPTGQDAQIYQSATLNATVIDPSSGPLYSTGNQFDLAISGDGWFAVQTPQGERYTRDGHFHLDAQGRLVTADGYQVLGESGALTITGPDVQVSATGEVSSGGKSVGKLKLMKLSDPATVTKEGKGLYGGGNPAPATAASVQQGWLEGSNADTMRLMVDMIATMRSYEMNQRVIQAQDATLQAVLDAAKR